MNSKKLAFQAELRALELIVTTMLGAAFSSVQDRGSEIERFTDAVVSSIASASIEDHPQAKREIFREAWHGYAMNIIAVATTFRPRLIPTDLKADW